MFLISVTMCDIRGSVISAKMVNLRLIYEPILRLIYETYIAQITNRGLEFRADPPTPPSAGGADRSYSYMRHLYLEIMDT